MVEDPPINMRRLRQRGRKPDAGDYFAIGLASGEYLFGRVIAGPLEREVAPMPGAYLIYVYRHRANEPTEMDRELLRPDQLLVPPKFVNQLGWTKGYFLPVGHAEVGTQDRLGRHCFRRASRQDFVDERGQVIEEFVEPCGEWGLGNHRSLDDSISDALNIERAPLS